MEKRLLKLDRSDDISNIKINIDIVFEMENGYANKVNGKEVYNILNDCLDKLLKEMNNATS